MKAKIKKAILVLLSVILVIALGWGSWQLYLSLTNTPVNVRITNVTASSTTISWVTRSPTKGLVVFSDDEDMGFWNYRGAKAYDDRDYSVAYLDSYYESKNVLEDNVEVTKFGKHYVHHVTIKNLSPENEYSFAIGNGLRWWDVESVESSAGEEDIALAETFDFTTREALTSIPAPYPSFGTVNSVVRNEEADIVFDNSVTDSIVYAALFNAGEERVTEYLSMVTNYHGGWTIDKGNFRGLDGEIFTEIDGNYIKVVAQLEAFATESQMVVVGNDEPMEGFYFGDIDYSKGVIAEALVGLQFETFAGEDDEESTDDSCPYPLVMTCGQNSSPEPAKSSASTAGSSYYSAWTVDTPSAGTPNSGSSSSSTPPSTNAVGDDYIDPDDPEEVKSASRRKDTGECLSIGPRRSDEGSCYCQEADGSGWTKIGGDCRSSAAVSPKDKCTQGGGSWDAKLNCCPLDGNCKAPNPVDPLTDPAKDPDMDSGPDYTDSSPPPVDSPASDDEWVNYGGAIVTQLDSDTACGGRCGDNEGLVCYRIQDADNQVVHDCMLGTTVARLAEQVRDACKDHNCGRTSVDVVGQGYGRVEINCGVVDSDNGVCANGSKCTNGWGNNKPGTCAPKVDSRCAACADGEGCAVAKRSADSDPGNNNKAVCYSSLSSREYTQFVEGLNGALEGNLLIVLPADADAANPSLLSTLVGQAYAEGESEAEVDEDYLVYFPEDGTYEMFVNGVYKDTLAVRGGEGEFFFIERNGEEGFQDPIDSDNVTDSDDLIIDLTGAKVEVRKIGEMFDLELKKGINIVSFPYFATESNDLPLMASEVLSEANKSDYKVSTITYFQNGRWMPGITPATNGTRGYTGSDFPITFGKGYLVIAETDMQGSDAIKVSGKALESPVPIAFGAGWNLVGIHGYTETFTAKTFLTSVNELDVVTANNITWWPTSKGRYDGLQLEDGVEYGFDFPLRDDMGYFVRVDQFTPVSPAQKSVIWAPGDDLHGQSGSGL